VTDRFKPKSIQAKPLNRPVVIAILALVLTSGGIFTWIEAHTAQNVMHAGMMSEALMLAASLDCDKIARLTGTPADLASPDYHYLRNQLIRIHNANPRYRYLYFFGKHSSQPPFFFMGTAAEDSADYSPPGQVYFEDSQTLNQVFETRSAAISPPFTDRWGTWVSALIPVVDPQRGVLLAVFGMDVDAKDWQNEILRRSMMPGIFTCLIIILMGAGSGYLRRLQMAGHIAVFKQTQEALRERERKYRLITENAADIIFTMNMNFQFTYFSPSVEKVRGFSPEEALAQSLDQIMTSESLQRAIMAMENTGHLIQKGDFNQKVSLELEQFRKDGSTFWTENELSFMFDEVGKPIGIIGVTRDISGRKGAEDELRTREDRFRSIIQGSSDMIFILDKAGTLSYESPSAARILGYPPDYFIGLSPLTLIHPDDLDLVTRELDEVFRSANDGSPTEFRLKTADGNWTWLESLASNQYDNPSIQGIVITARDISERKRAEAEKEKLSAQLLQAQKMEAVGHLAGGIAHDFNNMLSVVIGHTEMAMSDLLPGDALHKRLKTIHASALRSADLVHQLLAFARKQTVSPRVLDINDTISGMLVMLHRLIGEDIDLAWVPGRNLGMVRIDPSQIDQILANLMINSRDAIAGVGKVTIETDTVVFDDLYCTSHAYSSPGTYVLMAVSDSGCGMDINTVQQIFDPFFTTKAIGKGTGLGLATVYGIVKQNDGFINVYSEPGKGTTFRIYLPAVNALRDQVPDKLSDETLPMGTETVLITEDDADILELGQSILEQLGYTVLAAGTPDDALAVAKAYKGRIDLLITDVVMPQMNGKELAHRLCEATPGLRCIYMSGYTANVIAHHGVLDPGVRFLQKPFSIQEIAAKVREAIESR
jgi:two-component system, cell cycle sensor histidine kinase and response regulator CckA